MSLDTSTTSPYIGADGFICKPPQLEFKYPDTNYQPPDLINQPPHYKHGGIETIDFIEAKQFGYHLGNCVKYISRAAHKGSYLEDLRKARWYLARAIAQAEAAADPSRAHSSDR